MTKAVFNIRTFMTIIFVCTMPICSLAQEESKDVRKGNKFYEDEKYVESEIEYRKGLEKNQKSFEGTFNLGNSLYRQEKYPEAAQQFQNATAYANDKKRLAASYHNMGNALLKAQKIQESIGAYKQALRANPNDDETRTNLAYAQTLLQQQQQQQQNQQNQQQQEQENQQQQQNENRQQQQQEEQQEQQNQQQQEGMSKENAEQILNALLQDEKDVQDKVKQQQTQQNKRYRVTKDW